MKYLGGALLLIVTLAAVWWLPRVEAWSALGQVVVVAAKMAGVG